jgi:hypothetical protein
MGLALTVTRRGHVTVARAALFLHDQDPFRTLLAVVSML